MAKVKPHTVSDEVKRRLLGDFYNAVASLRNAEEVRNFLRDLLTPSELLMFSRRMQIAKFLLADYSYEKIRRELDVGFGTIQHVDRWLHHGFGGYERALEVTREKTALRTKYPLPFLLGSESARHRRRRVR